MKARQLPEFRLRDGLDDLKFWGNRYLADDDQPIVRIVAGIKKRGFLTKSNLRAVGQWKAARAARHLEVNKETYVHTVTGIALSAKNDQLRIEVLTLLIGVGWPTASVLLHWFHEDRYPILDYRALWSMGVDELPSGYWFEYWWAYVRATRLLAKKHKLEMRTLDRALWQYSKENQH